MVSDEEFDLSTESGRDLKEFTNLKGIKRFVK